jgi:hypothetical protein
MRFQAKVLLGQAIVFSVAAVIYIVGRGSLAGFVMLATAVLFGLWLSVFLYRHRNDDASEDEGSSMVVGTFPVGTTKAPLLAAATVLLGNGLVVGWWMVAVSGVIFLIVAGLYFFEYTTKRAVDTHPKHGVPHSLSELREKD